MTIHNSKIETRTVTALVNDKPGVLNRITSMLRRRGYNIQSLAVGHSEVDDLSRLTVIVEGGDDIVEKVTKQLHKLIDVIKVLDKVSLIEILVNSKILISEYFFKFSLTRSKITTVSFIE